MRRGVPYLRRGRRCVYGFYALLLRDGKEGGGREKVFGGKDRRVEIYLGRAAAFAKHLSYRRVEQVPDYLIVFKFYFCFLRVYIDIDAGGVNGEKDKENGHQIASDQFFECRVDGTAQRGITHVAGISEKELLAGPTPCGRWRADETFNGSDIGAHRDG